MTDDDKIIKMIPEKKLNYDGICDKKMTIYKDTMNTTVTITITCATTTSVVMYLDRPNMPRYLIMVAPQSIP